ncbi:hypothetical protein NE237_006102 [Protea cynaroides]|uniref:Transmembrane protein n=1 Tax=Protea cynaroides TaxID=273540 RepID=A0A9Q0QUZ7_9MAGN|nr:hypothetical protein NE237_006102 [Protea cynaroides]
MDDKKDSITFANEDWEQIYPLSLLSSSLSPSSSIQTHVRSEIDDQERPPSTGWEVVLRRQTPSVDDYSIFPPSNHEGLHVPFPDGRQEQEVAEEDPESEVEASTSTSTSGTDIEVLTPRLSDSSLRFAGDVVKQLRFGLEFLCSNFFRLASSVRSRVIRGRTINWSFASSIGVAAALLSSLLYMGVRRWRRRILLEKLDRLILLVQEQDEKISRLSQQITQMNDLLLARHTVPVLRNS